MGDDTTVGVLEGDKPVGESVVVSKASDLQGEAAGEATKREATAATPAPAQAQAPAAEAATATKGAEPPSEASVPHTEPVAAATRKRKAGQELPPAGGDAKAPASAGGAAAAAAVVGLVGGVKLEDLAPAVRKRMDEVLQKGEDDEMRQDVRLVNFLGEVEEAQVMH